MSNILRLPVSGSDEMDYFDVRRVVNTDTLEISAESRGITFTDMLDIVQAKTRATKVLYDNDNGKTLFVVPIKAIDFEDVANQTTIYETEAGNNSQSGDV